jgi:hypothetical protein
VKKDNEGERRRRQDATQPPRTTAVGGNRSIEDGGHDKHSSQRWSDHGKADRQGGDPQFSSTASMRRVC